MITRLKHKRVLFPLMILLMLFIATNVSAATSSRIAGYTQYDTSASVATEGWTQSDYAVLAYGENFPDALAAAPLAKKYNSPILLTEKRALTPIIKSTLQNLGVKNIFIVGGTAVVSQNVENELKSMGMSVSRFAGNDQYDTAVEIAKQLGPVQEISVVTGSNFTDALSIASISAAKNIPIILVPRDSIPNSVSSYLSSNSINKSYVVGNTDQISESVASRFPNCERISGYDKFSRNIAVLRKFNSDYDFSTVFIATGNGFADALSGTAYAARISSPIVLVDKDSMISDTQDYVNEKLPKVSSLKVLGGEAVISNSLIDKCINTNTQPTTPIDQGAKTQTIHVSDYIYDYTAEITLEEIVRGSKAWSMVKAANMFNKEPEEGYEYLLAKVNFNLLDIKDGKALNLSGYMFDLVSENGKVYDSGAIVSPKPELSAQLYKGASNKGWVVFKVEKTDLHPKITFGTKYDGTGGIWFKAYTE